MVRGSGGDLTDEDILATMRLMDSMDSEANKYRWVMKRYHKHNPIYMYRVWRGNQRAKKFTEGMHKATHKP